MSGKFRRKDKLLRKRAIADTLARKNEQNIKQRIISARKPFRSTILKDDVVDKACKDDGINKQENLCSDTLDSCDVIENEFANEFTNHSESDSDSDCDSDSNTGNTKTFCNKSFKRNIPYGGEQLNESNKSFSENNAEHDENQYDKIDYWDDALDSEYDVEGEEEDSGSNDSDSVLPRKRKQNDTDDENEQNDAYALKRELRQNIDNLQFDITQQAKDILNKREVCQPDENKLFAKSDKEEHTIGQFARRLSDFVKTAKLTKKNEIELLKIFKEFCGREYNVDALLSCKQTPAEKPTKIVYASKLSKYCLPPYRSVVMDVCSNRFCCVFVGELSNYRECPKCSAPRYRPCTRTWCISRYGGKDKCMHSTTFRKALKTINYQCIIPLFCDLATNPHFMTTLKYTHVKDNNFKYSDVSDGSSFIRNMREMQAKFEAYQAKHLDQQYVPINLCIAMSYDGVQVYRHKTSTFNPMLMTILNLPPEFRSKIGVGMFLLSLFTVKEKSHAEYFILYKCFLQELKCLEKGFLYPSGGKVYLIQVRLTSLLFDTPMLTKQLDVHGHSSYAACPICGVIYGANASGGSVSKPKRIGHRIFLQRLHYLRSWGQSEICCPQDFYKKHMISERLTGDHPFTVPLNIGRDICSVCDESNYNEIKQFLTDEKDKRNFIWNHNQIRFHSDYEYFRNYLYYIHCDYRPESDYNRLKKDDLAFVNIGKSTWEFETQPWFLSLKYFKLEEDLTWCVFHAQMGVSRHVLRDLTGESFSEKNRSKKYSQYLKQTLAHPYLYDIEEENNSCESMTKTTNPASSKRLKNEYFENMEIEENKTIAKRIRNKSTIKRMEDYVKQVNDEIKVNLKGVGNVERLLLPKDYLYQVPWKVSPKRLKVVESWINSLHIPTGLSSDFQLYDIFSREGQLRGTEVICIVQDLMEFMLIPCELPLPYQMYYSMLSLDMCQMSSSSIVDDSAIDALFLRVAETLSLHEGLFPIYLSDIVYHELADVVHHIKCQGPQKGFSTLASERANAVVKRFVLNGGRNYVATTLNNYLQVERSTMNRVYTSELQCSSSQGEIFQSLNKNTYFRRIKNGRAVQRIYNNLIFCMRNFKLQEKCKLTDYEMNHLLSTLLTEVEKQSHSIEDACNISALYKCYVTWLDMHNNYQKYSNIRKQYNFFLWIEAGEYHELSVDCAVLMEFKKLRYTLLRCFAKTCSVFSTEFTSRGIHLRIQEQEHFQEDLNNVKANWFDRNEYSSWCKYKTKSKRDLQFGSGMSDIKVCQINGFTRILLASDACLNGLPLVSIAPRKITEYYCQVWKFDSNSYNGLDNIFIAATNILPCRQLIAPFDSSDKPFRFRGKEFDSHSTDRKENLKYILGLSLKRKDENIGYNPSNKSYYQTIEDEFKKLI